MSKDKSPFPPDFFKHFTKEEFLAFFDGLFKEGVQQMLQGEMEEHLGYSKYKKEDKQTKNTRNGSSKKTLKTSRGEVPIEVPRDREATFEPKVVYQLLPFAFSCSSSRIQPLPNHCKKSSAKSSHRSTALSSTHLG